MYFDHAHIRLLSVVGAAATVLLATNANAQEYGSPAPYAAYNSVPEEMTITAPRYSPWRTVNGPYERVVMSVPVSYRDLNLHTGDGVYTLRQRVKYAARDICNKLTFRNPVGLPDSDGCYRHAVDNAMPQADAAIWNYRSPSSL